MDNKNQNSDAIKKKKKEPWRIAVFIISVAFIIFVWSTKDVIEVYKTLPKEAIVPVIATNIVVTLVKTMVLTLATLFVKWVIKKISGKGKGEK